MAFRLFQMRSDRRKWIYLVVGRGLLYYPQVFEGLSHGRRMSYVPHCLKKCARGTFYGILITSLKKIVQGPVGGNDRNMSWLICFI